MRLRRRTRDRRRGHQDRQARGKGPGSDAAGRQGRGARSWGWPVYQPKRVRDPEFIEILKQLAPDIIVVAAYGQILPEGRPELPRRGCINIHASLLPAYRGAAPINWAIISGERETGITIMQMDEGMDTGAILLQESIPIEPAGHGGHADGEAVRSRCEDHQGSAAPH